MSNKNVADYTNFEGKTNKRIVQAPGGKSTFSIGWTNDNFAFENAYGTKNKSINAKNPDLYENQSRNQAPNHGNFNYK